MALPVLVIATSQQCGHCRNFRGNGKLEQSANLATLKGQQWGPAMFKQLLTGGSGSKPKLRVLEIHMPRLGDQKLTDALSISEFLLEGGEVRQRLFTPSTDGKVLLTVDKAAPVETNAKDWPTFVNSMIPADFLNFTLVWPSWLFFSGDNWNAALQKRAPLYGYVGGLDTVPNPDGTGWKVTISANKTALQTFNPFDFAKTLTPADSRLVAPRALAPTSTEANPPRVITIPTYGATCTKLGYEIIA